MTPSPDQPERAASDPARGSALSEEKKTREDAAAKRVHSLLRDANEQLILSNVRAVELKESAEAARQEIEASEARFRSLVEASAAIVWRTDTAGRSLDTAPLWTALTGSTVEISLEWDWLDAVHPDDQKPTREAWNRAFTDGTPFDCEVRIRTSSGGWVWMQARAVRQEGADEWVGMMLDISDRKRFEEARERFVGMLGHDLRNPLSALAIGLSLLRESGSLSSSHLSVVERLVATTGRMNRLVRDLLDFTRGRLGGGIPLSLRECDLVTTCEHVVDEVSLSHPERSITYAGRGDLRGCWDPDRIQQMLTNLVGNAIQHGQGPVEVTAEDAGDQVVLRVINGGAPIPEALVATLFDPFGGRADRSSQGLGLGLYIVDEIVRAHGGTIAVESTGEGTIFTVRLPNVGSGEDPAL